MFAVDEAQFSDVIVNRVGVGEELKTADSHTAVGVATADALCEEEEKLDRNWTSVIRVSVGFGGSGLMMKS